MQTVNTSVMIVEMDPKEQILINLDNLRAKVLLNQAGFGTTDSLVGDLVAEVLQHVASLEKQLIETYEQDMLDGH